MAQRRVKMTLGIVGGLLMLLLLVAVLVPLLVPRDKLRSLAETQLRERTGGEVSLGELSLKVLPRLRLVLGESSLAVTDEGLRRAGQDPGPLRSGSLTLERLDVDLALWPLLRKQVEFDQVRLVKPRLEVVTMPTVADSAAGAAAAAPAGSADPGVGLALAAVAVRDGELAWREEGTGRAVTVRGWQQDLQAPALGTLLARLKRLGDPTAPDDQVDGDVALELDARVASIEFVGFGDNPPPPLEDLRLRARLGVPPAADRLDFEIAELSLPMLELAASGSGDASTMRIEELTLTTGEALQLDGSAALATPPNAGPLRVDLAGRIDLARLMPAVAPLMTPRGPEAAPLPELAGIVEVILDVDLAAVPALSDAAAWAAARGDGLDGRAELKATGNALTMTSAQLGEPLRVQKLDLVSDLRSRAGITRLELGGVQHPGLQGDVVAVVTAVTAGGATRVDLELPLLDLDALAELARQSTDGQARAGFSLVGAAWAATTARPAVGELIPPDLAVDLEARVRELRFLKTPYTDLTLVGTLRERVIDVTRLDAGIGSGRMRGTARLDYAADPGGRATWDVTLSDAPAAVIMKPYLGDFAELWTGNMSADARGACDLADPEAIRNSLTVEGDLTASDGTIDLRDALAEVQQYLGDRQDLLRVKYSEVDQHYQVREGKVVVTGLRIDGKDTDWTGGGWISLDGRLDMDLTVRLPASFTPDLGDMSFLADALRDDQGRIGLDFGLTGPTTRPAVKLKLDPAELMKSDAMQGKVEDEVKKGLGGLLDRLKGK